MSGSVKKTITAFSSGVLFAVGLGVAGMTDPANVRGFLDVGGAWRPGLALVMAAALAVYAIAYRVAKRRALTVHLASETRITPRLVIGSVIFGAGWGLSGFCPGPAIVSLGAGSVGALVFVATMVASSWLVRYAEQVESPLRLENALPRQR